MIRLLLSACGAFIFVFLTMPFFRSMAFRLKIVDFPGKRKMHRTMTPLLGGLAIYIGSLAGLYMNRHHFIELLPIIIGATIIMLLGLLDDMKGLSAQLRMFVQFIAALVVIIFGDRINFLPACWWGDAIEIIVSLIWIIGITNAFNYLDGLDGLAAGSAVINFVFFASVLYMTGQPGLFAFCVIVSGACLGFLPYNYKKGRKKIFLGDAGSTFLGFTLASIGLLGYWAEGSIVKTAIPILILGVPIFDMVFTTIMRIAEKKVKTVYEWLKYADKDHFHHHLVDLGLGISGSVLFIYFTSISLGLSAIMVNKGTPKEAMLSIIQGMMVMGMIGVLIVLGKRRGNNNSK